MGIAAAAYFDESNDHKRAYGVGGFLGNQFDCVHLEWAWREHILEKYELKYFKASELEYGFGEFAKFRDDPNNLNAKFSDREKKLFADIKTKTVDLFLQFEALVGFGAVVVLPDYFRLQTEFQVSGLALPAPYWFASQIVYMEAGWIMDYLNRDELPSESWYVRPTFDDHQEYRGGAKQIFDDYREKNPLWSKWLLPPHYESDQDYIVLQVADNLIYEMRKLVIRDAFSEVRPERMAMQRLKRSIWKIYKLNYEGLQAIMNVPENVMRLRPELFNPEHPLITGRKGRDKDSERED